MRRVTGMLGMGVLTGALSGPVTAGIDLVWTNPDGGSFSDVGNWSPNVVPGPIDNVLFDLSAATRYTVEFGQPSASRHLVVDSDEVLLSLAGFSYTVQGLALGDGDGNEGELFVDGGTLAVVSGAGLTVRIGKDPGATGRLQVENDAAFTTTETFVVGDAGLGLVEVDGAVTAQALTQLGDDVASDGTIVVDGALASLTLNAEAFVGNFGTGAISILGGGTADTTRVKIGDETGSIGDVSVDGPGSTWTDSVEIFVGNFGTGTLSVTNGGTVLGVAGTLGDDPGSSGTATISGPGSSWSSTSTLTVGDLGSGTLRVIDGGQVAVGTGYTQSGSGTLEAVIGPGTSGTMIDVGGSATLGGTLTVGLQAGHAPPAGTMYTVVSAAALNGGFATVNANDGLQVNVAGTTVTVTVGGGGVPGDVNGDGFVNVQDLIAVITSWGTDNSNADLSGNGIVGVEDLILVIVNWG